MKLNFNENLKSLRKSMDITQETLAQFLGVSFQTISKWERNEGFPDIEMLAGIASFFSVSTDELLGINKTFMEQKICDYIDLYEKESRRENADSIVDIFRQAVNEFPGEFRILIRYMESVIGKSLDKESALKITPEILNIYENIQNHCIDDNIRIWAKRLMCAHYKHIDKTFEMENILMKMPEMSDSRDYISSYLYSPGEKHEEACKNAMLRSLYLFHGSIVNCYYYNSNFSPEEKIQAAQNFLDVTRCVFPNGDYGKFSRFIANSFGLMGVWYGEIGNNGKCIEYLRKMAETAIIYDKLPDKSKYSSFLFKGTLFDKSEEYMQKFSTLCERMRHMMTEKYSLSEEIKNSSEYNSILDSL